MGFPENISLEINFFIEFIFKSFSSFKSAFDLNSFLDQSTRTFPIVVASTVRKQTKLLLQVFNKFCVEVKPGQTH